MWGKRASNPSRSCLNIPDVLEKSNSSYEYQRGKISTWHIVPNRIECQLLKTGTSLILYDPGLVVLAATATSAATAPAVFFMSSTVNRVFGGRSLAATAFQGWFALKKQLDCQQRNRGRKQNKGNYKDRKV
jgi:hypothetical protein